MSEPDINKLDKTIAVIEQKLDDGFKEVRATQKVMGEQNSKEHSDIISLVKDIEEKKAAKWVEKAVIGVVVFVFTAVGSALLALIFKL
jgi:flagellar motility protein MotE (MotC chaperone)